MRLVAYTAELAADEIDALDFYVARPRAAIYIDREVAKRRPKTARRRPLTGGGRKRVLVVLFVPSVQRDGVTAIDQAYWVDGA